MASAELKFSAVAKDQPIFPVVEDTHLGNAFGVDNGRAVNARKPFISEFLLHVSDGFAQQPRLLADVKGYIISSRFDPINLAYIYENNPTRRPHYDTFRFSSETISRTDVAQNFGESPAQLAFSIVR